MLRSEHTAYVAFEAADRNDRVFFQTLALFVPVRGKGQIRVAAVAKPDPDYQRMAKALVAQVTRELREQRRVA